MKPIDLSDLTQELLHLERHIPASLDSVLAALLSPELCGVRLAFDDFRESLGGCISASDADTWRPIKDVDVLRLRLLLERKFFLSVSRGLMKDALELVWATNRGLRLLKPEPMLPLHLNPEGFTIECYGHEHVRHYHEPFSKTVACQVFAKRINSAAP